MRQLLWPATVNGQVVAREITQILDDPVSRYRYLAFCQAENNAENAWFALAVGQYRHSPYWDEAEAIRYLFIHENLRNRREDAKCMVNISSAVRDTVMRDFDANQNRLPPQDLFDQALVEVLALLHKNTYSKYLADKSMGQEGMADGQMRAFHAHRKMHAAKANLKQYDTQLAQERQTARGLNVTRIQTQQEARAELKKCLRLASFDLSMMGLA
jgi:hypothetical protein